MKYGRRCVRLRLAHHRGLPMDRSNINLLHLYPYHRRFYIMKTKLDETGMRWLEHKWSPARWKSTELVLAPTSASLTPRPASTTIHTTMLVSQATTVEFSLINGHVLEYVVFWLLWRSDGFTDSREGEYHLARIQGRGFVSPKLEPRSNHSNPGELAAPRIR